MDVGQGLESKIPSGLSLIFSSERKKKPFVLFFFIVILRYIQTFGILKKNIIIISLIQLVNFIF